MALVNTIWLSLIIDTAQKTCNTICGPFLHPIRGNGKSIKPQESSQAEQ